VNTILKLDPSNSDPIFQQIVDEFEGLIISGTLKEGASMPSVRDFAVQHSINPNTVSKAYQLLQNMKLIEPIRGLGLKVSKIDLKTSQQRRRQILMTEVDRTLSVAKTLQASPSELIRLIQARWKGKI
jgi:GntR family transcriptional regulator